MGIGQSIYSISTLVIALFCVHAPTGRYRAPFFVLFSVIKISLAIVSHLVCAELTNFQAFLKMVLRSKAQKESIIIIRSKRGKTVQESPSSTISPGVESEKKRARSAAWKKLMFTVQVC